MNKKSWLLSYCKEKNITLAALSKEADVSYTVLREVHRNPHRNITIETIQKLYDYDNEITPDKYLSWEFLKVYDR